jgi:hypothetical protein
MSYELHIDKKHVANFATLDEALTRARDAVRERPDCETEILDSETKQAVEPASSRRWRDELSNEVGY